MQSDSDSGLIGPDQDDLTSFRSQFRLVGSVQNPQICQNQRLWVGTYEKWPKTTFCLFFLRLATHTAPIDLKLVKSFFSALFALEHNFESYPLEISPWYTIFIDFPILLKTPFQGFVEHLEPLQPWVWACKMVKNKKNFNFPKIDYITGKKTRNHDLTFSDHFVMIGKGRKTTFLGINPQTRKCSISVRKLILADLAFLGPSNGILVDVAEANRLWFWANRARSERFDKFQLSIRLGWLCAGPQKLPKMAKISFCE